MRIGTNGLRGNEAEGYPSVAGVCVELVGEEFSGYCDGGDDQPMYIEGIDSESLVDEDGGCWGWTVD